MEMDKKPHCPVIDIDGVIENGKQFDLEVTLPEDNRNVIFGVVKDIYKEPVENAVVKLIEVIYEHGNKEHRPVTHTFTDEDGEFVFGPLCPNKEYELQIFVSKVKHVKMATKCKPKGSKCLKGVKKDEYEDCKEICDEKEEKYEDKCPVIQPNFRY